MDAQIISMAQWKAAHKPAIVTWQYGLAAMLAWNEMWLRAFYGNR